MKRYRSKTQLTIEWLLSLSDMFNFELNEQYLVENQEVFHKKF